MLDGLRGFKGDKGDKGDTGGEIKSFANSLLVNGACENGSISDWAGVTNEGVENGFIIIGNSYPTELGMSINNVQSSSRRLYMAKFLEHNPISNKFIGCLAFDVNGNVTRNGDNTSDYVSAIPLIKTINANLIETVCYFGGFGNSNSSFSPNTRSFKFTFAGYNGKMKISQLVVKEVEQGTPVPYYLPFLPDNQMVYDPTTNEVGLHIGGQITWFQSV